MYFDHLPSFPKDFRLEFFVPFNLGLDTFPHADLIKVDTIHQNSELFDKLFFSHVAVLVVAVLESAAAVVDVTVHVAVQLLFELFIGGNARPAETAADEFGERV